MEIPVIGNGDITNAEKARDAFDRYGVDGVMIGRASFGAPWIFREVRELLDTGTATPIPVEEKLALLKRQISGVWSVSMNTAAYSHIRRHLAASPSSKVFTISARPESGFCASKSTMNYYPYSMK